MLNNFVSSINQQLKSKVLKKKSKKAVISVLSICCLISVLSMIYVLFITNSNSRQNEFIPPDFEMTAQTGTPVVPSHLEWSEIFHDGMTFKVGISGKIIVKENNHADIFLLNNKENNVWLKLRVLDENNNILGETGLIKPCEYVQSISFSENVTVGQKIKLKIMSYQPETYYSEGTIILNTTIKSEG